MNKLDVLKWIVSVIIVVGIISLLVIYPIALPILTVCVFFFFVCFIVKIEVMDRFF